MPLTYPHKLSRWLSSGLQTIRFLALTFSISILLNIEVYAEVAFNNTVSGTVRLVDSKGSVLADASNIVIFIDGLDVTFPPQTPEIPPRISHLGRMFSPAVLPLVQGSTVDFFNDDTIFHNVFSLSKAKRFDLGTYPQGTSKLVEFVNTGMIKIHCNIHPRMVSSILVLNNNLFATTDTNGHFKISGIPDGEMTVRVWSALSDEQDYAISLRNSEELVMDLEVRETKRFVQHRNKFGKRYSEKY